MVVWPLGLGLHAIWSNRMFTRARTRLMTRAAAWAPDPRAAADGAGRA
ncbi:hypothetical protein Rumeso_01439 [Rubellimicrobium mesophilum DSM 19309]|uniref:Uncharacterized protein n=1 Tax=Rubellimicrobium mesophilum DSM 19309 TaxID=442562 RepID=A0A017HQY6_9RHOB|nr:hypothetical protein Rumeso_01439 [Rubellimicrobium mesophilum DSM 19309]